jgi:hypothetical protein
MHIFSVGLRPAAMIFFHELFALLADGLNSLNKLLEKEFRGLTLGLSRLAAVRVRSWSYYSNFFEYIVAYKKNSLGQSLIE